VIYQLKTNNIVYFTISERHYPHMLQVAPLIRLYMFLFIFTCMIDFCAHYQINYVLITLFNLHEDMQMILEDDEVLRADVS
jgi:hypothetical protein